MFVSVITNGLNLFIKMLQINRDIKKIGNGNYISIPSSFLKEGILKKNQKYLITIEEADDEQISVKRKQKDEPMEWGGKIFSQK